MASTISAGTSTGTALNLVGDTSGALALQTNNGTTALTIDTSQNVGIGITSPSYKLQVGSGTADTRAVFSPNSAYAIGVANGSGFAGWIGGSGTADNMVFSSSGGTERMRIDSSGNVGIGVTPSAWNTFKVIECGLVGNSFFGQSGAAQVGVGFNSYYNSGWKYANGGQPATLYYQLAGVHTFVGTNVTGSAGGTIAYSQLLAFSNTKTVALEGATSVTGTGISFPATQSASSNANTLDDYEEGSWTPTDQSGASLSLTIQGAGYIKIGRLVYLSFYVSYPSNSSSAAAVIGGLPFTSASSPANVYGYFVGRTANNISGGPITWQIGGGSNALGANYQNASTGAPTNAQLSGSYALFSGCYYADN